MNTALPDVTGGLQRAAEPPAAPELDPLMVSKYSLDAPTCEEAQAEMWRFYQIPERDIDPGGKHTGQFVACFDGIIRGYDESELALRTRVAAELDIHPARIAVSYLDSWWLPNSWR